MKSLVRTINLASNSDQILRIKYLLLLLLTCIFLISCDQDSKNQIESTPAKVIPTLNDKNIEAFSLELAYDHFKSLDDLLQGFKTYKHNKDSFGFTRFRNFQWTPAYIEKKDYYAAVLQKNKTYLSKNAALPLFTNFENIIYLGLGLKNSFLDDNRAVMIKTLKEIKQDQAAVIATLKSMGLDDEFETLKTEHSTMFSPTKK